ANTARGTGNEHHFVVEQVVHAGPFCMEYVARRLASARQLATIRHSSGSCRQTRELAAASTRQPVRPVRTATRQPM
ncbi:MAG: hypothetical protein KA757_09770, partial [Vogesella sp.]|nr:hypothetical protein [Vogesella sp.]